MKNAAFRENDKKETLMKKTKSLFYIALIISALLYALTCGFAATSVKAPQTAFSTVNVEMTDGGTVSPSKASNVTLDIEKGTNKVYVYIGEIRSHRTDKDGNAYVNVVFDFKRQTSDDTNYLKRVGDGEESRIYLNAKSGGYKWTLVYDGGESTLDYNRVKISTVDEMDIYEVAFIDKDGNSLATTYRYGSDIEGESGHENICDERSSFTASKSAANNFTDGELVEIAAVRAVMRNDGSTLGKGVLNAEINAISVSVFGLNTFGLRFPSVIAGFALIIAVYLIATTLFGNDYAALFAFIVCLAGGSAFTSSFTAAGAISACFAVYAFYFAFKFFIEDYYVEEKKSTVLHIGLTGLFFGLAVAANASLLILLAGLIAIVVYAAIRGAKRYKAEEKAAKGLEKENVFVAYREKKIFFGVSSVCALVVLPALTVLASYAFVGSALDKIYRGGFLNASLAYIGSSFGFGADALLPFKTLVGSGGAGGGDYFAIANCFASLLCLVSLVFVIITLIFAGNKKFAEAAETSKNKTKLILTAFAASFIALVFGKSGSVADFALCSAFYSLIAALAFDSALKIFGKNIKTIAVVCVCVCFAAFAFGYIYGIVA